MYTDEPTIKLSVSPRSIMHQFAAESSGAASRFSPRGTPFARLPDSQSPNSAAMTSVRKTPRTPGDKKGRFGTFVVIDKTGRDAAAFPLNFDERDHYTFGRDGECDINIRIPHVSRLHARVVLDDNALWLTPLSKTQPTLLNGDTVMESTELFDNDIVSIGGREFRFVATEGALQLQGAAGTPVAQHLQAICEDEPTCMNTIDIKRKLNFDETISLPKGFSMSQAAAAAAAAQVDASAMSVEQDPFESSFDKENMYPNSSGLQKAVSPTSPVEEQKVVKSPPSSTKLQKLVNSLRKSLTTQSPSVAAATATAASILNTSGHFATYMPTPLRKASAERKARSDKSPTDSESSGIKKQRKSLQLQQQAIVASITVTPHRGKPLLKLQSAAKPDSKRRKSVQFAANLEDSCLFNIDQTTDEIKVQRELQQTQRDPAAASSGSDDLMCDEEISPIDGDFERIVPQSFGEEMEQAPAEEEESNQPEPEPFTPLEFTHGHMFSDIDDVEVPLSPIMPARTRKIENLVVKPEEQQEMEQHTEEPERRDSLDYSQNIEEEQANQQEEQHVEVAEQAAAEQSKQSDDLLEISLSYLTQAELDEYNARHTSQEGEEILKELREEDERMAPSAAVPEELAHASVTEASSPDVVPVVDRKRRRSGGRSSLSSPLASPLPESHRKRARVVEEDSPSLVAESVPANLVPQPSPLVDLFASPAPDAPLELRRQSLSTLPDLSACIKTTGIDTFRPIYPRLPAEMDVFEIPTPTVPKRSSTEVAIQPAQVKEEEKQANRTADLDDSMRDDAPATPYAEARIIAGVDVNRLHKVRVPQLRSMLAERNLSTVGHKKELAERLREALLLEEGDESAEEQEASEHVPSTDKEADEQVNSDAEPTGESNRRRSRRRSSAIPATPTASTSTAPTPRRSGRRKL